jgi:hypothetical protein
MGGLAVIQGAGACIMDSQQILRHQHLCNRFVSSNNFQALSAWIIQQIEL